MGYLLLGDAWSKLYGGLQGNGKSYSAVLQMAATFAAGGHVATNVKLKQDGMESLCLRRHGVRIKFEEQYKFLTDEEIPNFHENTPSGTDDSPNLVVIDECDLFWFKSDSQETKKKCRDLIKFLKLCRQENTLVIFMTQKKDLLDKSLRDLCENWDFRDMAKFRILGWKPLAAWLVSIQRPPSGAGALSKKWNRKDTSVFAAYDSRQFKGTVKRSGEKGKIELETVANGAGVRRFLARFWPLIAFLVLGWWFWFVDHTPEPLKAPEQPRPRVVNVAPRVSDRFVTDKTSVKPEQPEKEERPEFLAADGVSYAFPPDDVIIARHLEFGSRAVRIVLASPPYPRPEHVFLGEYSNILRKVPVQTGLDRGQRWVSFSDGTRASVFFSRYSLPPPDRAGIGNSNRAAGTPHTFPEQGAK